MSRKIHTTYNNDPSAGNDPDTNYIVAGDDGTGNPVGLSMDQIASSVAVRIGTSPPPTSNPSNFSVIVQDNTLSANIASITGITYTHWIIVVDSTTAPVYPAGVGSDVWAQGPVPPLNDLASWTAAEEWRLYVHNTATSTTTPIPTADGEGFLTVQANDTKPPTEVTPSIGTITGTSAVVSWTAATDNESGISHYNLLLTGPAGEVYRTNNVVSGTTLSDLVPASVYEVQIEAYDNAGNVSLTEDPVPFTTSTVSSGILSLPTPTAVNEGNDQTITVNRTEATTGDVYVSIETPQYTQETAIEGTQYYKRGVLSLSPGDITRADASNANINSTNIGLEMKAGDIVVVTSDGTYATEYSTTADDEATVTIVDNDNVTYPFQNGDPGVGNDDTGGTETTVDTGVVKIADSTSSGTLLITTINSSSIYNNLYQVDLRSGSEVAGSGAAAAPTISTPAATFAQINGSGGASDEYLMALDGTEYVTYINAISYSSKTSDGSSNWVRNSSIQDDTHATDPAIDSMWVDAGFNKSSITGNDVELVFKVKTHASSSGTAYVWGRSYITSSSHNNTFVGADRGDNMSPITPSITNNDNADWQWDEALSSGVESTYTYTPGDSITISLFMRESQQAFSQIAVVDANAATYTPADALQDESSTTSAAATDNPSNPTTLILPGDGSASYDSTVPANGATNVAPTTGITILYAGSEISVNPDGVTMTEDPTGTPVAFAVSSVTANADRTGITVFPSTTLANNTPYRVNIGSATERAGTIVVDNVRTNLAVENFTFTTRDSSTALLNVDFSSTTYGAGTVFNDTVLRHFFDNANGSVSGAVSMYEGHITLVNDPEGNSARGKVMQVFCAAGSWGTGRTVEGTDVASTGQFFWDIVAAQRSKTMYYAYDIRLDPGKADYLAQKLPGLRAFRTGDGTDTWTIGDTYSHTNFRSLNPGEVRRMTLYHCNYDTQCFPVNSCNRKKDNWTTDNPGDELETELYSCPKDGSWVTFYVKEVMNTVDADGGFAYDGERHVWVRDPRPSNAALQEDKGTDGEFQLMYTATNKAQRAPGAPAGMMWDMLFWTMFVGGSTPDYAITEDQYMWFDNIIVSKNPIYSVP